MRTIHVLRKPCSEGTVAANVLKFGTGAINVDACRLSKPVGRWPANVIHDGSVGVVSAFPDTGTSTGGRIGNASGVYTNQGRTGWGMGHEAGDPGFGDSGTAARYFQHIKAKAKE